MRSVDTNVLVRLVTRDDDVQVAAAEIFVERGAWVSQLVLAETTWVLRAVYNLDHASIATAVEMLLNVVTMALANFRRKPALGFSDCLVVEIARSAGHTPLGTFDKALAKLDGTERL